MTRLLVGFADQGLRLDQFLAGATDLSRRRCREMIAAGQVWRNGTALRVQSREVHGGDVIDVLRPAGELGCPARPAPAPVHLLYEDSWLVMADKPAGVLSQPSSGSGNEETFDRRLLLFLAARDGRRPELRLVHRLDRQTSGVMLFSRHSQALAPLTGAWQRGEVERLYLAVVTGRPGFEGCELQKPIKRDRSHTWRFCVSEDGKPARTRVRVLHLSQGNTSLLACSLVTGRTHQVRVHLAAAGLPVLGDRLYGGPPAAGDRMLLHATCLALPHPRDRSPLQVVSSPPDEFHPFLPGRFEELLQELIASLRRTGA